MRSPALLLLYALPAALTHGHFEEDEVIDSITNGKVDAIVDMRTMAEWEQGHIPGAFFVDFHMKESPPFDVSLLAGCERCKILTYCHSGGRAKMGADLLDANGFTAVTDGLGIMQWQAAGMDLVNTPSMKPSCLGTGICTPIAPSILAKVPASSPGPISPLAIGLVAALLAPFAAGKLAAPSGPALL